VDNVVVDEEVEDSAVVVDVDVVEEEDDAYQDVDEDIHQVVEA